VPGALERGMSSLDRSVAGMLLVQNPPVLMTALQKYSDLPKNAALDKSTLTLHGASKVTLELAYLLVKAYEAAPGVYIVPLDVPPAADADADEDEDVAEDSDENAAAGSGLTRIGRVQAKCVLSDDQQGSCILARGSAHWPCCNQRLGDQHLSRTRGGAAR
jgi:hypothetical protein